MRKLSFLLSFIVSFLILNDAESSPLLQASEKSPSPKRPSTFQLSPDPLKKAKIAEEEEENEAPSPTHIQPSDNGCLKNGVHNEEEEEEETRLDPPQEVPTLNHFFGLSQESEKVGSFLDSRSYHPDLTLLKHSFLKWHQESLKLLQEMTPKVRKVLTRPGYADKKNLLMCQVSLLSCSQNIAVKKDNSLWVSGWPSKYDQKCLKEHFPNHQFEFIANKVPDFNNKSPGEQGAYLAEKIEEGFALEKHSFLIPQRLDHQKNNFDRARNELGHLRITYLHTEQGLMLYLSSVEFMEAFKEALKNVQDNPSEITLVINIASSRSVCMNCADRLFRESEWGVGFLQALTNLAFQKYNIQKINLYFLASAFEAYPDRFDKSSELARFYKRRPSTDHHKMGFNHQQLSIEFFSDPQKRERFQEGIPYIGHFFALKVKDS